METIIDVIEHRLTQGRSNTSFAFLEDGENAGTPLSLLALRQASLSIASALPADGAVVILLPQGLSFLKAFFGCLYARAIAVPVSMPSKNRGLANINAIVADASVSVGITHRSVLDNLQRWFGEDYSSIGIEWLFIEEFSESGSVAFDVPRAQQLAFLQYTSGSTGDPKAVMVSHENIMANSTIIQSCFRNTTESTSVCWLPSFHDMGLIDGIIQPVFSGFQCVLMSPTHFLQRPARWLKAITKYGATYSGGPNFAYDFCVERITDEELPGIDLTRLRCLYNGAEPLRARTIRRFVERFAPVGFDATKIFTCYGLAEATLAVTTSTLGKAPNIMKTASSELVSCGGVYEDTQLRIVNPETLELCEDGDVGEIWIAGKSVTAGYHNRPTQTASTFVQYEGTVFLRSGDLGFMENRELFVTGRIKDLIIIRGKNHYPQDIEQTISGAHPSLQPNACAVFSCDSEGEEQLIAVQEIRRTFLNTADYKDVVKTIFTAISQHHGVNPLDVVIVKPGSVPKTTSGKIRRSTCRQMWSEANLQSLVSLSDYKQ